MSDELIFICSGLFDKYRKEQLEKLLSEKAEADRKHQAQLDWKCKQLFYERWLVSYGNEALITFKSKEDADEYVKITHSPQSHFITKIQFVEPKSN